MFGTYAVVAILQSVALIALFLIGLGIGLSVLTWWFWTTARPEPVSLAPLEIMSDRRYIQASEDNRKQMIDSARELVLAAQISRTPHRPMRRAERHVQPESVSSKPVDPLLK
ncbi:MAG: hypothetical protein AAB018_03575 [Actinomycetota bacterium]